MNYLKNLWENPAEWGRMVESAIGAQLINAAHIFRFQFVLLET